MSKTVRPMNDRVLVKPTPRPTETASGIVLQENWQPDVVGTVVSLGSGLEARKRAVQRFADTLITDLDRAGVRAALLERIRLQRDAYQPEHVCQVGDTVLFGVMAGTELELNGEKYLLVKEDDLEAVLSGSTT